MVTTAAQAPSRERVVRICRSAADARALRLELLNEIGRVVPFDAYAWLLTDPETSVGSSPLADVPCLPELPDLIRLKYLTEVNRWTRLDSSVALLAEATGGDPSRSLLWREMLCRHGIVDVASVVLSDQFGCWGFLDLWRVPAHGRFSASDAAYLMSIVEPVTNALRRSQADTFMVPSRHGSHRRGPVVLLLSGEVQVLAQTSENQEYLRVLVPPDGDRSPIPRAPTTSPRSSWPSRRMSTGIHPRLECTSRMAAG